MPPWLPAGTCWDKLPETIRDAVSRFVAPAYRRFVLDAASEMERAVGNTLVQVMWLELSAQVQMAQAIADPDPLDALLQDPEQMLDRHLRLAGVKCRTAELMVKLRVINESLERGKATSAPLTPNPSPASGRGEAVTRPDLCGPASLLPSMLDTPHGSSAAALPFLNPDPRTLNPPAVPPKLEKSNPADQLSHPALALIAARPDLFSRQGYLTATFRRRQGKTFGPYYLLNYRENGRLQSIYLGRPGELVEQVRQGSTPGTARSPSTGCSTAWKNRFAPRCGWKESAFARCYARLGCG